LDTHFNKDDGDNDDDDDDGDNNNNNNNNNKFPFHAMQAHMVCRGTVPLILNFGTRWM